MPTGKPIGEPSRANHAVFSPDGKRLVTAGGTPLEEAHFYDARTGLQAAKAVKHNFAVAALAFSPDGKFVVSGGYDAATHGFLELVDAATGKFLTHDIRLEGRLVREIAFAPAGNILAVQSDRGMELFPVPSWPELRSGPRLLARSGIIVPDPGSNTDSDIFVFSPDGQKLLTMSGAGQVRLWDASSAAPLGASLQFSRDPQRLWAAFDPTGATMLTTDLQSRLLRWQLPPPPAIRKLDLGAAVGVYSMAIPPGGKPVAIAATHQATDQRWSTAIRFCDRNTGNLVGEPILVLEELSPRKIAFSPDGKILMALNCDNPRSTYGVQMWNTQTRKPIGKPLAVTPARFPINWSDSSYPFAFRADSKRLVVAVGDAAHVIDTSTGRGVGKPLKHGLAGAPPEVPIGLTALAFCPEGTWIAGGTNTGSVIVWNVETGEMVGPILSGSGYAVTLVAFSPDGARLVSCTRKDGSAACAIHLWNWRTGHKIGGPIPHEQGYAPPGVSSDGKILLTKTSYTTARLWDLETGKPRGRNLRLNGYGGMALSPDGKLVVTQISDLLQWWDVCTGQPVGKPRRVFTDARFSFSPDSRSLLYLDSQQPRVWEIPQPMQGDPARLRLWVEVITGRELDEGGEVAELNAKAWQERHDRLQKLGGPP